MEIIKTEIEGLLIIKPKVFEDERGYFYESYNEQAYQQNGIAMNFVQDNQSKSKRGVLRGLHFQNPPFAQGKLIRVLSGCVFDVAVDIRKDSETYGQWHSVILSEDNKLQYWIPPGFAHGFLTLENDTILSYKCTELYNKEAEGSIRWNDPDLKISWSYYDPILSDKDKDATLFKDFVSLF
ncbi:MAG: dTDP-4-dehydrorhamnose 3,5-epimerase [Bacteroidetes bacterium]|nr:dTDP-4-dehydrorhamnose 3,5-epimerase [Bacteroidota bacterium]MBT3422381.1 dTDP-4-dehydrorhamnose 3,5-epimerase [Bacteroidota bacterium]MBT3800589.1 dTDP-4-dehydrorhamnose 3,5-epimerase [Bacteroidota bacterium]MBT3932864.1 dTDP-4-dehydrorhamnose 3,5-epimerase [Bacteroidota bacterium]MBT4730043.1 dTDP-4-dehydrorhamnose 3,5-epimerase [Bacteroidota bacterium]